MRLAVLEGTLKRSRNDGQRFSATREPRMLSSMSLSRTFAPPPALGVASFYAFFFYAVTSPADRTRT